MPKWSGCYKNQLDHVLKTQGLSATRGHLPRALPATRQGVCHLPLWRLQPSTSAEGSRLQGGALHPGSVVEQVFRQLDVCRNRVHDPHPRISSFLEKH